MGAEARVREKAATLSAGTLIAALLVGVTGCASTNSDMYEDESRIRQAVHRAENDKGQLSEVVVHHIWQSCATVTILYRDKGSRSAVATKEDEFWKVHYPKGKSTSGDEITTEERCRWLATERP
ncbi:hypothetical protein [Austwickia chelonae]|uniref:hypothetical protein n=1 Tax=Austwickia chelonae TaxID=100225 RepID=UPI0013C30699|nr:hypothetical protein [Austwickia chelonae]